VKLQTETGKEIEIQKTIMEDDFYSADHFEIELPCNMTELV
jgi:hypothetical protein